MALNTSANRQWSDPARGLKSAIHRPCGPHGPTPAVGRLTNSPVEQPAATRPLPPALETTPSSNAVSQNEKAQSQNEIDNDIDKAQAGIERCINADQIGDEHKIGGKVAPKKRPNAQAEAAARSSTRFAGPVAQRPGGMMSRQQRLSSSQTSAPVFFFKNTTRRSAWRQKDCPGHQGTAAATGQK